MTTLIDRDTLRQWLDTGQPVTVLDIRTDEDRAQWAIPGSLHLNAYDALRDGQPGPLADAPLPAPEGGSGPGDCYYPGSGNPPDLREHG